MLSMQGSLALKGRRVAAMRAQRLVGISRANRTACGIAEREVIEIDLEIDTQLKKCRSHRTWPTR